MNNMTNYLKNKVLNENLQGVYVALFNNETEVLEASYKRQIATFLSSTEGQTSNNSDVLFPIATESWGEITHVGVFDSSTDGNLLFKSKAEYIKNIDVSSQYKIPKNYLIIRLK